MSWQTLRPQVKTLLESVTVGGSKAIQEVYGTPTLKAGGNPFAYVVHSDSSADYETTTENIRTYAFVVRIFYKTKNVGVATALQRLEKVVDAVLDEFDQEDQRGASTRTVGVNLPSGYTFLNILAHPSEWGEFPGEQLVMAEIRVQVRLSRSVT